MRSSQSLTAFFLVLQTPSSGENLSVLREEQKKIARCFVLIINRTSFRYNERATGGRVHECSVGDQGLLCSVVFLFLH